MTTYDIIREIEIILSEIVRLRTFNKFLMKTDNPNLHPYAINEKVETLIVLLTERRAELMKLIQQKHAETNKL